MHNSCVNCGADFTVEFAEEEYEALFCVSCGEKIEITEITLTDDLSQIIEDEDAETYYISK